jgi:hypothetical protein
MPWKPFNEKGKLIEKYYTRDNLINSQLYFNSAKNFNDPFDLSPFFYVDGTYGELKESIRNTITNEKCLKKKADRRSFELIKQQRLYSMSGRKAGVKRTMDRMMQIGVCCFTTNSPDTILMWSHYGDNHTGICLEFEFLDNIYLDGDTDSFIPPLSVTYSNNLPKLNLLNYTIDDLLYCLRTKSTEWKYENEYRTLLRNYIGTISYSPYLLKAVISGCKMHNNEFEELNKTIKKMKIQPHLFRSHKKEKEFGLELIEVFPHKLDK